MQQLQASILLSLVDKLFFGIVISGFALIFHERFKRAQAQQLEQFKVELLGRVESARQLRAAIGDLTKRLAAATHSIMWLTWVAKHHPDELKLDDFRNYDKELHEQLSAIVQARVAVAALDPKAHAKLSELVKRLYTLDVQVGHAKARYGRNPEAATRELGSLHFEAAEIDDDLLAEMTSMWSSVNAEVGATAGA